MTQRKEGVQFDHMYPQIEKILPFLDEVHQKIAGRDAIIISARDSQHIATSKHYEGKALDLKTDDITEVQVEKITVKLQNKLGGDYDVVNEKTHIHIEYDPRTDSYSF